MSPMEDAETPVEDAVAEAAEEQEQQPRKFERPPKQPKTPEDLAAIALLDKLRSGEGETRPSGLPLACIVKVVDYYEVPKAHEQYAMATVEGRDGLRWKLCVFRYYLEKGMRALFVSEEAGLPMADDRFLNLDVCKVQERVYRFGFGVKERRRVPHVKHGIYHYNCGVLYPLDAFPELSRLRVGTICAAKLHIDSAEDLHRRVILANSLPRPKKSQIFVVPPKPVKKPKPKPVAPPPPPRPAAKPSRPAAPLPLPEVQRPSPVAKDDSFAKARLRQKRLLMQQGGDAAPGGTTDQP